MVKDPICKMMIEEKTAAGKAEYQGQTYYFCTLHCKRAFEKEPAKYVRQSKSPTERHSHHQH